MSLDLRSGDALIDLVREGFGAHLVRTLSAF